MRPRDGSTDIKGGTVQADDRPVASRLRGARSAARGEEDYKVVCVRLRAREFEQFARDVEAMQLTSSMALRIAARRIGGFLEIDHEVRRTLADLLQAVGRLSEAVRDLHGTCLAGGTVSVEQLDDQRATFGAAFVQIDAMLRAILNVSRRREDGRALLTEAAAE